MMFLVLVTAILASALAQSDPPPLCCNIDQYETGIRILTASFNRTSGEALRGKGVANLTYDRVNMRGYFSYQGSDDSGAEENYQVINLFRENRRYRISGGSCEVGETTRAMTPNCIPGTARARRPTYIGQYGDHLSARSYVFQAEGSPNVRVDVLANQECFPITVRLSGSENNYDFMSERSYFGATVGIRNPSVFIPPASCTTS